MAPTYHPSDNSTYKLPHGVAAASDRTAMILQKTLNSAGIKVISIGQDYLISIPSLALFPEQSPRLTWNAYPVLNKIVLYMKQFRKIGVNITSYSNKYVSVRREQALTLARARAVGDYLWSQGIDSRFIFTEGAGSDKPITDYSPAGDRSPNSRIEITFRDAIV
jgi:intracellular multiplication protein IcmN